MPIPVACECGAKFAAQDRLAGKSVKCPKCSRPISIPAAGTIPAKGATASPQAKPKPAEPAAGIGSILDEFGMEASKTGVRCPDCGADMKPEAIVCVKCGYHVKTGKKIAAETDAVAAQRREAMLEQRRKAAEKAGLSSEIGSVSSGGKESLGGVFEASTAILIHPTITFSKLRPRGGVYEAFEYAFSAALAVGMFWMVYYGLMLFVMQLSVIFQNPELAEEMGTNINKALPALAGAVAIFAVAYVVLISVVLLVQGSLMGAGAHLILKYVGGSELPWTSALKVVVYNMGAMYVLSIVPCLNIFAPVWCIYTTVTGFTVLHKVNPGVALLAWFVGAAITVVVFVMIYAIAGAMLIGLLTMLAPQNR